MATRRAHGRVRTTYAFVTANRKQHGVQEMCRILGVAPSDYNEWLKQPLSNRPQEDARLLKLLRAPSWPVRGSTAHRACSWTTEKPVNGIARHFRFSTTSGSASLMSARIRPSVSPRQSASSAMRCGICSDTDCSPFGRGFFMFWFQALEPLATRRAAATPSRFAYSAFDR